MERFSLRILERESMSTVTKAIDLLFALSQRGRPQPLSVLASEVGWPKPTVHRLLQSLSHRQLVARTDAGLYGLGPGLMILGLRTLGGEALIRSCRPTLAEHCQSLGETFFLVTATAGEATVRDIVEGSGFVRASPQVGARLPLHATAVGRLFLAFAPDQVNVGHSLERFTRNTPTGPRLEQLIDRTRRDGFSVSMDEWCEGLSAVAAPVLVHKKMLGAIAMACPTPRLPELGQQAAVQAVLTAARQAAQTIQGQEARS